MLDYRKKIKAGKSKVIINELHQLAATTLANAEAYYLLGSAYKEIADFKQARTYLEFAAAMDCSLERMNPILNAIIRRYSEKNDVAFIDFDKIANLNFGRDVLFLNEDTPSNIYYLRFKDELLSLMTQFYDL